MSIAYSDYVPLMNTLVKCCLREAACVFQSPTAINTVYPECKVCQYPPHLVNA